MRAGRELARVNGGLFLDGACLAAPRSCLPSWVGGPLLKSPLGDQRGYRFEFYPGSPAPARDGRTPGTQDMTSYAITATPIEPGRTGGALYCGDSSGRLCYARRDGVRWIPPQVVDGRCTTCTELK